MVGAIIFAISLSIDALGIGVSYGVRKIRIPFKAKVIISLISALMTGFAIFIGEKISEFVSAQAANWVGILLLLFMGVWVIVQGFRNSKDDGDDGQNMQNNLVVQMKDETIFRLLIKSLGITIEIIKNPKHGDLNQSKSIEPTEAFYIGLALSMDSLGAGIAIGTLGFSGVLIPFAVACGQFIFLTVGSSFGKKVPEGKMWVFVSGCLLIAMALIRIL